MTRAKQNCVCARVSCFPSHQLDSTKAITIGLAASSRLNTSRQAAEARKLRGFFSPFASGHALLARPRLRRQVSKNFRVGADGEMSPH